MKEKYYEIITTTLLGIGFFGILTYIVLRIISILTSVGSQNLEGISNLLFSGPFETNIDLILILIVFVLGLLVVIYYEEIDK